MSSARSYCVGRVLLHHTLTSWHDRHELQFYSFISMLSSCVQLRETAIRGALLTIYCCSSLIHEIKSTYLL